MSNVSRLDILYRRLLLSKFFVKGWGDPAHIKKLLEFKEVITSRSRCFYLVDKYHPIEITKDKSYADFEVANGRFRSPLVDYVGDVVHPDIAEARFQILIPKEWSSSTGYRPMCIHLAGTGDHYFWKRRHLMVRPLLAKGIGAIILENPFYGYRKPKEQSRSCLLNVSDIFVMGGCLILEVIALLHFCERMGFGPLGVTGLSMGGHMATLAATNWPKPVVLVPCLSGTTASTVFTEGVMSEAINWDLLQSQFQSNALYSEQLSKRCKIVDDPSDSGLASIPAFKSTLQTIAEKYEEERKLGMHHFLTPHDVIGLISSDNHNEHILDQNNNPYLDVVVRSTTKSKKRRWLLHGGLNLKQAVSALRDDVNTMRSRDQKAIWFMRGLMDECTHVRNFTAPAEASLVIAVVATADAYIPRVGASCSESLADVWPGATVKYVKSGHVGAYLRHLQLFHSSILEGFERAKAMYNPPEGPIYLFKLK